MNFPKLTGKEAPEFINPDLSESYVQASPATPVTPEELDKDIHGYTNPDLHRRIQDSEDRDAYSFASETFESNLTQGAILEVTDSVGVLEIELCEYWGADGYQRLIPGIDYTPISARRIQLLNTSRVIPATAENTASLKITYLYQCDSDEGIQPNDYSLIITGVNSYRTTVRHIHQEIAGGPGENEIP